MNHPTDTHRGWSDRRILTLVALATVIVSVVWRTPELLRFLSLRLGELLFALTLTMALTYVLRPAVRLLVRQPAFGNTPRGRALATTVVYTAAIALFWALVLLGLRPVSADIRGLVHGLWPSTPAARLALIASWKASLQQAIAPYQSFLPPGFLNDPKFLSNQAATVAARSAQWLRAQSAHAGFLVELFLIPVLAFYFLSEGPAIRREADLLTPPAWRPAVARIGSHFDEVLDAYVRGQAWMCCIAWLLTTVMLTLLRVPHAAALGLFAGITRAVPVIGPMLGAVPLLFITLIYTRSIETTLILLVLFTLMHFLESKVLLPKIVGHHVDLHPVSVILALLLGLAFFGFLGVFLAVPVAAVGKVLLVEWYAQREAQAARAANANVALPPLASSPPVAFVGTSSGLPSGNGTVETGAVPALSPPVTASDPLA